VIDTNFQFEASRLIEIVQPRAFVPVWERTPWATEQRGLLEVSTERLLEASVELLETPVSGVGELNGLSKFQLPVCSALLTDGSKLQLKNCSKRCSKLPPSTHSELHINSYSELLRA